MTWNDEIVEEVRSVRDEYAAKFNYDISAICADIRKKNLNFQVDNRFTLTV